MTQRRSFRNFSL